ncbi:MAG: heparinase II/III family protein, partial [Candidatus Poribacteria bacterium]
YGGETLLKDIRKEHPRLLVLKGDEQRVKSLIQTNSQAKAIYESLKREAEKLLDQPPVEYELIGPRLLHISRRCLHRIQTLGTMYRLDGDDKYLQRAKKELMAVAKFKDWHPEHFLDTAEMTLAFAIGYDWLYDSLTDEERGIIRKAIIEKGLEPAREAYEGEKPWRWWVNCDHNWNQVCNGGIVLGALAIAEDEPELCEYILDQSLKSIPKAMKEFAPDGGWTEGPGYWNYATRYNVYFLAGLKTALGDDFGLSKMQGFPETGLFRIHFVSPTNLTFNFADAGAGAGSAAQMFWMSREFNKPEYAWHERHYSHGADAFALWWFDPSAYDYKSLPLDAFYKGIDVAFFRSAYEDPNAIFIGFKGGDNKANHSHLDLGTFVLDVFGKRWAVDIGPDDYNLPNYFGKDRWTYYRLNTKGHNVLVIDGENQDPKAEAPIIKFKSEPDHAFAITDLSSAYAKNTKRVMRGMAFYDRSRIVIQDEVEADDPVEIVWGFHTTANIEIDGKKAILSLDDSHIVIRIVEPSDAEFKIVSAQPPKPQAQNEGISNLTIQLPKETKNARIVVEIIPYRDKIPPFTEMNIYPLNEWD